MLSSEINSFERYSVMKFSHIKICVSIFVTCFVLPCAAKKNNQKISACVATDSFNTAVDVYENLGRTHFILGYTPETIPKVIRKYESAVKPTSTIADSFAFLCDDGCIKHAFFSPDDQLQEKLLQLIRSEKKSIKLTAYAFTNGDIAQELANAAQRKIAIEMVVDPNVLQDAYSKIEIVHDEGISIFVYNPQYNVCADKKMKKPARSFVTLMHNKFIIFGNNIADKKLIWTGSCNLTNLALRSSKTKINKHGKQAQGADGNQENAVVTDELRFIKKYEAQFEKLKERSKSYNEIKNAVQFFKRR